MKLSRWVVSAVGTALLAGLLWWFGPLWPPLEPVLPRVVGVQALLLVWAVANAVGDWRRRRRADALGAGLSEASEERAAVAASLGRALSLLGKRRRAALTELPWYAIIGPPGAGKTTALLNAGLTFPLAAELGKAPIPGAGGTRLCDWWFTDSAVLIDTAGRYTTQDSSREIDRAGWSAFLALLKRTRPAQPLNGVIVAVGVADIAAAPAAERTAHAGAIASRLAELEDAFGLRLPVYALFTKADLVTGFAEFFDDLDAAGRDQVWGETFPLAPAPPPEGVLRALAERTATRLPRRLAEESRADRRLPIAGFPTQLASFGPALAAFASAAFGTAMLRGLYLASGTQEGTPIDRLAGTMARTFGLPPERTPQTGVGRSYFLGRLLREVVFGEATLVRRNPALVRRRRLIRFAGYAAVALLLAGGAAVMLLSAREAEGQLGPVSGALSAYTRTAEPLTADTLADGDGRAILPLLDAARALAGAVPTEGVPLGLGQAPKLEAGAKAVYRDALSFALFPRLLWRLEADMRGALQDPVQLYDKLRVYLMLGGAGPLDEAAVRSWFAADWKRADPDDDAPLAPMLVHLDALLAEPLPAAQLDTALIAAARASIERVPTPARVYATLKTSAAAAALPSWRPVESLGPAGVGLFTRASGAPLTDGIPGLFTAAGFRAVLGPALPAAARQVASESWVFGRTADATPAADVENGVEALYAAEFTSRWDAMLADLAIAPIGSLPQAAQAFYILASPESPLRSLLRSIAMQIQVPGKTPPRYAALINLATGDGAALDRSLRLLADIQQTLAKIAALPLGTTLPAGGEDIGTALQADAARQPAPVGGWLTALAASATALRTGDARRQISLLYNAPGGPAALCAAAMTHYPFAAGGTPLAQEDFARVFGPTGAFAAFLNTRLKPFIDTGTTPWSPRAGAPLGTADVSLLQRTSAIRAAFFPEGGSDAAFPIEVGPATPSRTATLTLGGVPVETGKGVARPALVTWPPAGAAEATLDTEGAGPPVRETGFWAPVRLLQRGRVRSAGKAGDTVTFGSPPDLAAFTVRSPALTPGLLTNFRCPAIP